MDGGIMCCLPARLSNHNSFCKLCVFLPGSGTALYRKHIGGLLHGSFASSRCCLRKPSPPPFLFSSSKSTAATPFLHSSPPSESFQKELAQLLALLPPHIRTRIEGHPEVPQLIEIILDLGRRPVARFPSGDFHLAEDVFTMAELEQAVSLVGEFGDDNRAGIDRTLHRISAIRNRAGRIVGLTCRVGRAISGSAEMVRDLVESGGSLLLMGPPGVGKTTAIREISRLLSDEYNNRVVIVDTSNEIAGDGDIPHAGIGRARRMQVPNVDMQHKIMIEAVENHMPETIVIDEIGTELEALAAGTIAQRGVQLVGTAHGVSVENLIKNPSLQMLAGGIQSVTLGDDEARRRGVQKSVLERKGPPTFTAAAEMVSRTEWRIHHSLAATVDALLAGRTPLFEVRRMDENGKVTSGLLIGALETKYRSINFRVAGSGSDMSTDEEEEDESDDDADGGTQETPQLWRPGDAPLQLYTYQISETSLEQVVEVMGLEDAIQPTDDIRAADAVLTLRSKLKQSSWVRGIAKLRQLPVFAIKANTMPQMVRALRTLLGMESLATSPLFSAGKSKEEGNASLEGVTRSQTISRKSTPEDEIDALEEARLAVEQIVIPKGQPVELLPRSSEIIALQIKLVESYQLIVETAGADGSVRLRILPYHKNGDANTTGKNMNMSLGSLSMSGTSVSRLPILPE